MNAEEKATKRYNVVLSKLFQIVINLDEEQQEALLCHAEALLVKDKRSGIRRSCSIPINYAAYDRVYSNHIKNISPKGLFIETQRPLLVGDEIIMIFRLEGFDKPLKVRGGDRPRNAVRGWGGIQKHQPLHRRNARKRYQADEIKRFADTLSISPAQTSP